MAQKRYNEESFTAIANGHEYTFFAHTTNTRSGFCHTIRTYREYTNICTDTKVSYFNRTWERFRYETALRRAIEKCPKEDRNALYGVLIEGKAQEEQKKAEDFLNAFESAYKGLNEKSREILAESVGNIHNEAQANAALYMAQMLNVLQ